MEATVNGVKLVYERAGEGEPLLLIMGLGTPRLGWALQIPALSEHFDVVWYDNRGVGDSEVPATQWQLGDMVNDAVALMDHLGWESANVAGISMGGMIAQELTVRHPERVRKLALLATQAGGETQVLPAMETYEAFGADADPAERLRKGVEITFGRKFQRENPELVEQLIQMFAADGAGLGSAGFFMQSLAIGMWSNSGGVYGRLSEISCPTLVLHGEADELIPVGNGKLIADSIPDAKLVTFPEIGHAVNVEALEQVNSELIAHFS